MNVREILGKHLAILLVADGDSGETEMMVVHGEVVDRDGSVFLDRGVRGQFGIRDEWHDRVRAANGQSRAILESEYYLPLSVGALPEGDDPAAYEATGIMWLPPKRG